MRQWEHKQISEKLARFYHRDVWGARDIPKLGRVVSVGKNGIRVWDRDTGQCLSWREPSGGRGLRFLIAIRAFSISPDGDFVFLHDQVVWRLPLDGLAASRCIGEVPDHYRSLLLADDGDTMAAYNTSGDGYHVYSLSTGKTIRAERSVLDNLEFSPDSKLLLSDYTQCWQSGSDTLQFDVTRLSDGECLLAEERTTYERTVYFSTDNLAVLYGDYGKPAWQTYPLEAEEKKRKAEVIGTLAPDSPPPFYRSFKPVKAQFERWETGTNPGEI